MSADESPALPNLTALLAERPRTKMGQVKAAWPYIRQALMAGHKLTVICERLQADGIDIHYNRLSEYLGRLERRGYVAAPRPPLTVAGKTDPVANLRERLDRPSGFAFGGTGKKEDLI